MESKPNEASTCAKYQATEPSRDVATGGNLLKDESVSNILLARAQDMDHWSVTEETASNDHCDAVQVPIESVNITEVVLKDLWAIAFRGNTRRGTISGGRGYYG